MKKEDTPQDPSALVGVTRDVCYVKDENGKYTTDLSIGWDIKKQALDNAWQDIHDRIAEAALLVKTEKKSPIYYFMELRLMDLSVLSGYTGFWQFTIKRHFKPNIFKTLNDKVLLRYSQAFDISVDELKNFNG
jgi:hypothetical protein